MTPAFSEHDLLPFNAICDMIAALHNGNSLTPIVDDIPEDRQPELLVYALSIAYGAIDLACKFLDVTVDEFLAERHNVFAQMRSEQ